MSKGPLYYFGPELTFSHEAAARMRARQPAWAAADLEPQPSAGAIFDAVLADSNSGAIVPTYNHVQGDVIDFMRFCLLKRVDRLDLPIQYGLFSRQQSLKNITRLYTKDTVVPQVSRWLAGLRGRVEVISSLEMSTAEAAGRAAADPASGAICSTAAGDAHQLNKVADVPADRTDNFTRFGLFVRPGNWWPSPDELESFEHPVHFTGGLWKRIREGEAAFYWPISLHSESKLHLGHLSVLLTLRKLAGWGNQTRALLDREMVDDHTLYNYWNGLQAVMGERPFEVRIDELPAPHWIRVDSIECVQDILGGSRPALLLDPVPGIDGYARMSARRDNMVSWPLRPRQLENTPGLPQIVDRFFGPARLAAAGFDWDWGSY